jgi:hypothetical protein
MLYSRYATREHIDVNENNSQLDKKGLGGTWKY